MAKKKANPFAKSAKKKNLKEFETKREKSSTKDRIAELEKELSTTKYNKKTQGAIGLLKAKIAMLKEKESKRSSSKGKQEGYAVRKTGDGTVIMVGFPSVGKSTLLNRLTNADSDVGSYAFTTLSVIPGLLEHRHAKIQILDVPGVVEGAASGKGRGKEVLSAAMSADMVMMLIDVFHPEHLRILQKEVYDSHLRLNKTKPDIKIVKTAKGGINIGTTVRLTKTDKPTITRVLKEFKIVNADITIRTDIDVDELIDSIEKNKRYVPGLTVLNKVDLCSEDQLKKAKKEVNPDICISAETGYNIEKLKDLIFSRLNLIRIYCKEAGEKADLEEPLIMFRDASLRDMCLKLHKDFADKFRFARVWGKSVKFDGQRLRNQKHTLKDGDIVELHIS